MRLILLLGLLVAGLPDTNNAFCQAASDLAAGWAGHSLVLRNYYTDAHLSFDSDGRLLSSGTPGFGPSDGRVYIEDARIENGKLRLKADRLIDVYNEFTKQLRPTSFGRSTSIEIAIGKNDASQDAVAGLLRSIFLTSAETEQLRCTAEEEKAFATRLEMRHIDKLLSSQKQSEPSAAKNSPPPQTLCYPMGDRAYIVAGRGAEPPKAVKSPDPAYPSSASNAHATETVVLMLIVDTDGKPSSFIIERSAGYGFDEATLNAVRKWKFKSGQLNDKPVAFAINVEVNFRH